MKIFKSIKDFKVKGKRVLVRCDFDVPLKEDGTILDDFRIKKSVETIKYLVDKKAKVILISHLGRPGGKFVKELSLSLVAKRLEGILGNKIIKLADSIGKEVESVVDKMKEGDVVMLENLRFYPGEEKNDLGFAKKIAILGDIYVNDAFATSHRNHASIVLLPKLVSSCAAGLSLKKELNVLSKVITNPWRPLLIIIGGAKVESKIKVVKSLLKLSDHIILAGKVANFILEAKNVIPGKLIINDDIFKEFEKINITDPKIHLPVDGLISLIESKENYFRVGGIGSLTREETVFDIGPETIKVFSEVIKSAKMILWAGPMGKFEDKRFEKGTKEIALAISFNHSAFKIVGGGDTVSAVKKFGLIDCFDYVCSGGGAMLEFLTNKNLPGLKVLGFKL
jgi:phosphoglycerate kinase